MSITGSYYSPLMPVMRSPDGAIKFAQSAANNAYSFLNQLGLAVSGTSIPTITPTFPALPGVPPVTSVAAPELDPVVISPPTAPTSLTAQLSVDSIMPEPFDDAPPDLGFGAAPSTFSDVAPLPPGVDVSYTMPELSLALPTPPSLMSLTISGFNGVDMPSLEDDVPQLTAIVPSVAMYTPGEYYTSSLLTQVQSTLLDRIANGGTGLAPAAEQAIWDREREREAIAADDAIRDLERMETMGYAMPPGAYMDARLKVNTEMHARQISLGRDIAIKQAELELENVRQSLGAAVQLESTMLTYTNQVEQRLFEASKYATEASIEIYNAKVRAYAAFLDAYKTKVSIYEARIRGELAKVEVYKAQIQAEQAKAEVNSALVQQYKVQTDAALADVEVFKARVAAIQSKADLEKLKIAVFGEEVRAYTARIGAYTAQVEGFRATVSAEASKQDAYKSRVDAYTARVNAAAKTIDARIEEYKGKIMAKTAEWEGYKAAYSGETSRAQAITASNQSRIEGYKAAVLETTGYNEVLTKQWQVSIDQAQRVSEIGLGAARANAELYMTARSMATDAAKVGAQVSAQIAAASLNAVNYSYSNSAGSNIGFSSSWSQSDSRSDSRSTSQSTSRSTSQSTSASANVNTNINISQ
jgi:hypothetical protein